MGLFDIFTTTDQTNAANDQIAGIKAGQTAATGNINSGIGAINTNYTAALQPFMQNYTQAQGGVQQLGNVLGLNGPQGNATAQQTLQATPGYQFQVNAGNNAINAQAAATGQNASGNQALALSNYDQGVAGTTYNNYVQSLMPFLGASNSAAGGAANVNMGQGNALAGQYGNLANMNYSSATGIGNANANADLAGLTASGNMINAGLGVAKTAASIFSDERLKEDIAKVGELDDGSNVYRYKYIGDNIWRIGLMAQEVEQTNPEAVTEIGGYKAVDYGKATQYAADLSRFLEAA